MPLCINQFSLPVVGLITMKIGHISGQELLHSCFSYSFIVDFTSSYFPQYRMQHVKFSLLLKNITKSIKSDSKHTEFSLLSSIAVCFVSFMVR